MKFFYNNLGIRTLIIYFYCMLIDLINNYKNIYSRSNDACLGFVRWFLYALLLLKIIVSMKRGYAMVFYAHCYF